MDISESKHISFDFFYKKNNHRFFNFAYSYVKDEDVAKDIVSDSFIILLNQLPELNEDSNIEAYCLTIVRNKCLDFLRQQETRLRTISNLQDIALWEIQTNISSLEACDPSEIFSKEIEKIVNETLEELGPRTSEVFTLSRMQNKTYKEIADKLEISTKGVEFHITKALTLLRKRLKDYIS